MSTKDKIWLFILWLFAGIAGGYFSPIFWAWVRK